MKMILTSASFTHRGGVRAHNEDAFLEAPQSGLWLVADGMGGYDAGDVASQLICNTVARKLNDTADPLTAGELEQSLHYANRRIRQYGADVLGGKTLGSTVAALLIEAGQYHLFWAGDSRCYMARSRKLIQLSRDHSQVADMVEQGALRADQADNHPLAHVITRALGVDPQIELDYRTGGVADGDLFLLCTDGVSKEFTSDQLVALASADSIDDASLAIMHSALVNKCNDNITCIIVNVKEDCYSPLSSAQIEDATIPICRR